MEGPQANVTVAADAAVGIRYRVRGKVENSKYSEYEKIVLQTLNMNLLFTYTLIPYTGAKQGVI